MKLKDKTSGFTHKYPSPVAAGQLYAQSDVKGSEHDDILNVADSQETGPEDSVSNVSRSKANCPELTLHFVKLSRVSAASSAHIKAEAEKNEKCDAALKKTNI